MNRSEAGKLGYLKSKQTIEAKAMAFKEKYLNNPKFCKHCDKSLPYNKRHNKFCDNSCAASFLNTLRVCPSNYVSGDWAIISHNCLFCSKQFEAKRKQVFCSHKCSKDYEWKKRRDSIINNGFVTQNHKETAKRFLYEELGKKCSICGIDKWLDNELVLILDHIDGNSNNWNLDNLRLLCPNCDSQTPTYKGRNLGKGRHIRRQRYKEGKSY